MVSISSGLTVLVRQCMWIMMVVNDEQQQRCWWRVLKVRLLPVCVAVGVG